MKKLILVVIDGLPAGLLEGALDDGRLPTLGLLAEQGRYRRAASAFPSLTPVCLSTLATGAHPAVHRIPHLVWYHRGERRLVEYGSSFRAMRAAGTRRAILDTILEMNRSHLGREAVTVFEALETAGVTAAAINFTCYRGLTPHRTTLPGVRQTVHGPRRFFYFNLFESDVTGAPLAVRRRARGTVDAYAVAVGRWLVTRDGFDFLVFYLSDFDFASHAAGPDGALGTLARSDAAVGTLIEAAGGPDAFLDRYDVIVCSDHGQSRVHRAVRLQERFADVGGVLVTASNRAGMVYRLPDCRVGVRDLAARLDTERAVDVTLFLEDDEAVARREGEELRFSPQGDGWRTAGDLTLLDHPDALARVWGALQNPNAGELLVSAVPGLEFADLGGDHHAGGGSHGSLAAADSEVPVLTLGVDADVRSITDIAPLVLTRFGVEPPSYARLARAA
ncbi:MAG: alkaline phosphatase family protein [Actinomycetota bacterium]|nr:alkaline phosphatase family protein [Actinomycetota bacterium]